MGTFTLEMISLSDADYIGKHNRNSEAIRDGLTEMYDGIQNRREQGMPNGYARLTTDAQLSYANLPDISGYITTVEQHRWRGGYSTYSSNKARPSQLGITTFEVVGIYQGPNLPLAYLFLTPESWQMKDERGVEGGYCDLDEDRRIPLSYISPAFVQFTSEYDVPGGYPKIDLVTHKVGVARIRDMATKLPMADYQLTSERGQPDGYASLNTIRQVPIEQLDIAALRTALGL